MTWDENGSRTNIERGALLMEISGKDTIFGITLHLLSTSETTSVTIIESIITAVTVVKQITVLVTVTPSVSFAMLALRCSSIITWHVRRLVVHDSRRKLW